MATNGNAGLAMREAGIEAIERILATGDLAKLSIEQRVVYHNAVCDSMGLNPLTRPFDFITLNGKMVLYARRECTDQLRRRDGVSITELTHQMSGDLLIVTARACDKSGRLDAATGAVSMAGLKGEAAANATMKAETKAKRRVTLSICGLGVLDESEIEQAAAAPIAQPARASQAPTPVVAAAQPAMAAASATQAPPAGGEPRGTTITTAQAREFCRAALESGWSNVQVREALATRWGIHASTDIPADKYADILRQFRNGALDPPDGSYQAQEEDIPF